MPSQPNHEALIEQLAGELRPARSPRRPRTLALLWLAGSWLFVVAAMGLAAPFRPGFAEQLLDFPRFAGETLFGGIAGVLTILAAFALGDPSVPVARRAVRAFGLLLVWAGFYVLGLLGAPALEPSTLGMRPYCVFEVIVWGVPTLVAGLLLLRRLAPLRRVWTGALVGAAAGAIPALLMEIACMYVPSHILSFHLGPMLLVALLGAALGPLLLRRI